MATLNYQKSDGSVLKLEFTEQPLTLGRGKDADVQIMDNEISRIHAAIRIWQGEFIIKDLGSTNGTFVNGVRVDLAKLRHGDKIRIGNTTFDFEMQKPPGQSTIIRNVEQEMAGGKGYTTILREVIKQTDRKPPPA